MKLNRERSNTLESGFGGGGSTRFSSSSTMTATMTTTTTTAGGSLRERTHTLDNGTVLRDRSHVHSTQSNHFHYFTETVGLRERSHTSGSHYDAIEYGTNHTNNSFSSVTTTASTAYAASPPMSPLRVKTTSSTATTTAGVTVPTTTIDHMNSTERHLVFLQQPSLAVNTTGALPSSSSSISPQQKQRQRRSKPSSHPVIDWIQRLRISIPRSFLFSNSSSSNSAVDTGCSYTITSGTATTTTTTLSSNKEQQQQQQYVPVYIIKGLDQVVFGTLPAADAITFLGVVKPPRYLWYMLSGIFCDVVQLLLDMMLHFLFQIQDASTCWALGFLLSIIVRHTSHRYLVFGDYVGGYFNSLARMYMGYSIIVTLSTVFNIFMTRILRIPHYWAWIATLLWTGIANYFILKKIWSFGGKSKPHAKTNATTTTSTNAANNCTTPTASNTSTTVIS